MQPMSADKWEFFLTFEWTEGKPCQPDPDGWSLVSVSGVTQDNSVCEGVSSLEAGAVLLWARPKVKA